MFFVRIFLFLFAVSGFVLVKSYHEKKNKTAPITSFILLLPQIKKNQICYLAFFTWKAQQVLSSNYPKINIHEAKIIYSNKNEIFPKIEFDLLMPAVNMFVSSWQFDFKLFMKNLYCTIMGDLWEDIWCQNHALTTARECRSAYIS